MTTLSRAAPFVLIAAAFAAGIAVDAAWPAHPWLLACVLAAAALTTVQAVYLRQRGRVWCAGLLLLAGLGALRHAVAAPGATHAASHLIGQRLVIDAVVDDEPLERPSIIVLRLRARRVATEGGALQEADFEMLARLPPDLEGAAHWRYGDRVRIEGVLVRPPRIEGFDYRLHLARQGVFVWMPRVDRAQWLAYDPPYPAWASLLALKDALRQAVRATLPSPESALLNGILIGDDNALPESVQEAFRRTGTSHIISISGFNVSVIVGMVLLALGRVAHPRRAAPMLIVLLWIYALFVGASASVVRAVAMTSIALVGQLLWRRGFTLNTLCAAAFFLLLASPFYLFDIGFQLSFAATLGLVLFADRLSQPFAARLDATGAHPRINKAVRLVVDGVLLTSAAQLTTLPLIAVHYGQLSLITLLTNAAILPLQPPIMALGMLAAGAGALSRDLGALLAWPVFALLRASIWVVEATAQAEWAAVPLPGIAMPATAAYYAVLGAGGLYWAQPPLVRRACVSWLRARAVAGAGLLSVVLVLGTSVASTYFARDGRLRIGLNGSSAALWLPDGRTVVLLGDGDLDALLTPRLPPWRRTIDVMVVAKLDARTLERGTLILQTMGVENIVLPAPAVQTDTVYGAWVALGGQAADPTFELSDDGGLWVERMRPDDLGNGQLSLRARCERLGIDIVGRADVPDSYVLQQAAVIRPSKHNISALKRSRLDWLIWVQAPRAFDRLPEHRPKHTLNLEENAMLELVCENGRLQLAAGY